MPRSDSSEHPESSSGRVLAGLLGALLLGVALYAAGWLRQGAGLWYWVGVIVLGLVGAEAVVSALMGRRSLLSRLGPLP